jgi:multiple sugar transport system permease protein
VTKEIEEAALIDGASRWSILTRIFLPASVPALATLATFTFLYAWNSFFWPLVVVNTGNTRAQVLTLAWCLSWPSVTTWPASPAAA